MAIRELKCHPWIHPMATTTETPRWSRTTLWILNEVRVGTGVEEPLAYRMSSGMVVGGKLGWYSLPAESDMGGRALRGHQYIGTEGRITTGIECSTVSHHRTPPIVWSQKPEEILAEE